MILNSFKIEINNLQTFTLDGNHFPFVLKQSFSDFAYLLEQAQIYLESNVNDSQDHCLIHTLRCNGITESQLNDVYPILKSCRISNKTLEQIAQKLDVTFEITVVAKNKTLKKKIFNKNQPKIIQFEVLRYGTVGHYCPKILFNINTIRSMLDYYSIHYSPSLVSMKLTTLVQLLVENGAFMKSTTYFPNIFV